MDQRQNTQYSQIQVHVVDASVFHREPFNPNKNKYVNNKITHMWRRWGTPQNFFLAFIDELEKQLFIKKNCWSGPIENIRILIFNNGDIIILHLCTKNLDDMI